MRSEFPGGIILESTPLESTGGKVWNASLETYKVLHRIFYGLDSTTPVNVLELGSGCGWFGLRLAQEFPNMQVTMSEQDGFGAMEWLRHNISLNPEISANAMPLDWGNVSSVVHDYQWDIIVGTELVYSYQGARLLAKVIDELLVKPGAVCYYGHSLNRFEAVDELFMTEIERRNLYMEVIFGAEHLKVRPGQYTELFKDLELVVFQFHKSSDS